MDAHLANYRYRQNITAAERNRVGFPVIGHKSHHLIDWITTLTEKLYNRRLYTWWPTTFKESLGILKFGFVPPQPRKEQIHVTRDSVSHLSAGMQFLAIKQMSRVPILPVQTKAEIALYSKTIAHYLSGLSYDFEKMCYDWNNGLLPLQDHSMREKPDGKLIRAKLPCHLESHFKNGATAMLKAQMLRQKRPLLLPLKEAIRISAIPINAHVGTASRIQNPPHSNLFPKALIIPGVLAATRHGENPITSLSSGAQLSSGARKQRSCRNCQRVGCKGSKRGGGKGMNCDVLCQRGCRNTNCHGGKIIHCNLE